GLGSRRCRRRGRRGARAGAGHRRGRGRVILIATACCEEGRGSSNRAAVHEEAPTRYGGRQGESRLVGHVWLRIGCESDSVGGPWLVTASPQLEAGGVDLGMTKSSRQSIHSNN